MIRVPAGPIRHGDRTTGGGVVVSCALATDYTIDGIPGAVLGDMATCPRHGGVFPFVECDDSTSYHGKGVVLEGHKLACGCHAFSSCAPTFRVTPTSPQAGSSSDGTEPKADGLPVETTAASVVSNLAAAADKPPVCLDCLLAGAKSAAPLLGR